MGAVTHFAHVRTTFAHVAHDAMASCGICANENDDDVPQKHTCGACKYVCCRPCMQRYLLSMVNQPSCINPECAIPLTYTALVDACSDEWVEDTLRVHRETAASKIRAASARNPVCTMYSALVDACGVRLANMCQLCQCPTCHAVIQNVDSCKNICCLLCHTVFDSNTGYGLFCFVELAAPLRSQIYTTSTSTSTSTSTAGAPRKKWLDSYRPELGRANSRSWLELSQTPNCDLFVCQFFIKLLAVD